MNNLSSTSSKKKLVLIELNEVNFDVVRMYIASYPGKFLAIEKLLSMNQIETSSESVYEELEPWIQWASVHTGKSYSEHQLFRLGDIVGSKVPQMFEQLEADGISVGCISPMNAENRLKKASYFIPDPWTNTPSDDSWWSRRLGSAIAQAVNDNAQSKLTKKSLVIILLGFMRFAKLKNYPSFFILACQSFGASWRKALFLDLLLHDVHVRLSLNRQPQFSVLFLNAGAHIQHHYFHNALFVSGRPQFPNPAWYIQSGLDPFCEMLEIYDRIISEYISNSANELIIATGLSQCPYDRVKYYYRLKNHSVFLRKVGINFLNIYPRMTRDFLVTFSSPGEASKAQALLSGLVIYGKKEPLFGEIENRGNELFVTLTYPDEIFPVDMLNVNKEGIRLLDEVAFVAIKNGMHQSKGFAFFTPGIAVHAPDNGDHVKNLYFTVMNYFGDKSGNNK